jgi:uncharacterized membrane protein YoaK (UPF0700 family)
MDNQTFLSPLNISGQVSESILLGTLLSLSGGFMDAYTYIGRGGVFANAQTGNILLLGVNLSEGRWDMALRYFLPVFAFVFGIALSDLLRYRFKDDPNVIHWRQITILAAALVLAAVGFIPQTLNLLANCLVSFSCGIQVESFRKINGTSMATTMCIGNLRAATEYYTEYAIGRNLQSGRKAGLFLGMIVVFVAGAVMGNTCVLIWKEHAIYVSAALLFIGFLLMFIHNQDDVYSV